MTDNNKPSSTKPSLLLWNFKHHSRKPLPEWAQEVKYTCSPCPSPRYTSRQSVFVGVAEWLLIVEFPQCSAEDQVPWAGSLWLSSLCSPSVRPWGVGGGELNAPKCSLLYLPQCCQPFLESWFGRATAPGHLDIRADFAPHPLIHEGLANIFSFNFVEAVLEYLLVIGKNMSAAAWKQSSLRVINFITEVLPKTGLADTKFTECITCSPT